MKEGEIEYSHAKNGFVYTSDKNKDFEINKDEADDENDDEYDDESDEDDEDEEEDDSGIHSDQEVKQKGGKAQEDQIQQGKEIKCAKNHSMELLFVNPYGNLYLTCDTCDNQDMDDSKGFYHCGRCDYDLCLKCTKVSKEFVKQAKKRFY